MGDNESSVRESGILRVFNNETFSFGNEVSADFGQYGTCLPTKHGTNIQFDSSYE